MCLFKKIIIVVTTFISLTAQSQSNDSFRTTFLKIRRVPFKYIEASWIPFYEITWRSLKWEFGDSAYSSIVKMGTSAIPNLIPILSDTNTTMIFNSCDKNILRYGQLAAILIDDIETINYSYVTRMEWCVGSNCSKLPLGFLEHIKLHAKEFQENYKRYFYSKTRQGWLRFERKIRKQNS